MEDSVGAGASIAVLVDAEGRGAAAYLISITAAWLPAVAEDVWVGRGAGSSVVIVAYHFISVLQSIWRRASLTVALARILQARKAVTFILAEVDALLNGHVA